MFEARGRSSRSAAIDVQSVEADNPRVQTGPHGHNDLELLYFRTGSGPHMVMNRMVPVAPGDVVLLPPGVVHDLSMVQDATGWAVEFSPTVLEGMTGLGQSLQLWRSNPLLSPFLAAESQTDAGLFHVEEADRPRWERLLQELDAEFRGIRPQSDLAVRAYLLLILLEVARLGGDVEDELRHRQEPLLADTFGVIEKHFAQELSARDVAEVVGMSPGHLTTVVRERTGRTIGEWITERRMAEARLLLSGTDLPVEMIARRVGFRDPAYFNRRFRQVHGESPGAWRK
ncbi:MULTISPECIES: helix-turn-helix domain-containing protein [unclassified Rhodococcus (in: high G+C Gram-positive bacteria)]|uniref:AraC family transcriptional regulator n=1 Tax=Rhodococcus sp. SJ-3 TaxID=3454628 RepID=UPI003F78CBFE